MLLRILSDHTKLRVKTTIENALNRSNTYGLDTRKFWKESLVIVTVPDLCLFKHFDYKLTERVIVQFFLYICNAQLIDEKVGKVS